LAYPYFFMLKKIRESVSKFKKELKVYRLVLEDRRTPCLAKWLLGLAVAYFLSPADLIPDFIPVIGHLDDLVIIPLLVYLALRLIPKDVVNDSRRRAG